MTLCITEDIEISLSDHDDDDDYDSEEDSKQFILIYVLISSTAKFDTSYNKTETRNFSRSSAGNLGMSSFSVPSFVCVNISV